MSRHWTKPEKLEPWTDERRERLKQLWDDGRSASQIAEELGGTTRNAVIGVINRMGWTRSADVAAQNYRQAMRDMKARQAAQRERVRNNLAAINAARKAERDARQAQKVEERKPVPVDATHAKPWLQRTFGECAYPISGEGADTFSCCTPCGDRTYCRAHRRAMFTKPPEPPSKFAKGVTRWAA